MLDDNGSFSRLPTWEALSVLSLADITMTARVKKKSNRYPRGLSCRTGKARKWYLHTQTRTSNNSTRKDKRESVCPTQTHTSRFVCAVCRCVIFSMKAHKAVSSTAWRGCLDDAKLICPGPLYRNRPKPFTTAGQTTTCVVPNRDHS